jgi:hypothetical protein
MGFLYKFLQLFIKGHLLLQISIHMCMHVVKLPLYVILGLIYITNVHFELMVDWSASSFLAGKDGMLCILH